MKRFFLALQFLTILPIKVKPKLEKEDFGKSLLWFPFVGALIGIILSLSVFFLSFLPKGVIAALILIESIIITGGIHLDGFADTCDGLYGFSTKEKSLEIMRESRIGTMAAIGVALLLLLKFSLFASIRQELLWKYLITMAVFARWAQAWSCFSFPYAREEGKAKYFVEYAGKRQLIIGAIFTLAFFILLWGVKGLVLFLSSFFVIWVLANYIYRKISGMTGDTIGAVNEVAEVSALLFGLILSV